jgi:hypothetical protein
MPSGGSRRERFYYPKALLLGCQPLVAWLPVLLLAEFLLLNPDDYCFYCCFFLAGPMIMII